MNFFHTAYTFTQLFSSKTAFLTFHFAIILKINILHFRHFCTFLSFTDFSPKIKPKPAKENCYAT